MTTEIKAASRLGRAFLFAAFAMAMGIWASTAFAGNDEKLAKGDILLNTYKVKGSDIPKVVVQGVVDAPIEQVWEVIRDCNQYEDRMPNIKEAKLIKKEKSNVFICQTTVDLPFPLSNLTAITRAVHSEGPDVWSRKWNLVRGDYRLNSGSWVLKRFMGSKNRTLAIYTSHAEPTTSIPDWVRNKAQKSALPGLIERLREEARKIK